MKKDFDTEYRDDELATKSVKRIAKIKGIEDPLVIAAEVQKARSDLKNGAINLIAPMEVLEAIQRGEPFDGSKVLALNPDHQAELDKMFRIGSVAKAKRAINSILGR